MKSRIIATQNIEISLKTINGNDYVSLTDMAKQRNADDPRYVVQNWMKTRATVDFLAVWEEFNNPNFNRVYSDTVKKDVGLNSYVLTPKKWCDSTGAIGISSSSGRYGGGTFAHLEIAMEFASWLSPEFKYYVIKEYQRLKQTELKQQSLEWNLSRTLAKINYHIHTDAVKEFLIPPEVTKEQAKFIYADEADLLNVALFGKTAKKWRNDNPELAKKGNMRDFAPIEHLIVLSNLEGINAMLIVDGISSEKRIVKLNKTAITQLKSLYSDNRIHQLGNTVLKHIEK